MTARIALLRGVNLGRARRVGMAEARQAVEAAGFTKVRSVLQSGNLVFEAGSAREAKISAALEQALRERLGLATEVIVRTGPEWRAMIAANPYPEAAADDPAHLVAMLLPAEAAPGIDARLSALAGRERFAAVGRTLYIHYRDGIAASPLTGAALDRALGVRGTARNWNTVLRLAALVAA
jgi:uncharacterized protein (DUF1697 family)